MITFEEYNISENMKKRVESLADTIANADNVKAMIAWNEYDDSRKGAKYDAKYLKKAKEIITKYKISVSK